MRQRKLKQFYRLIIVRHITSPPKASKGKRIHTTSFKNHDNEELLLIGALVDRDTPFAVPGGLLFSFETLLGSIGPGQAQRRRNVGRPVQNHQFYIRCNTVTASQ
jgi:hypothetical protein